MQSSWHFYLQFVLERVSLTLYFDKTAKLPVHNLSVSYLQIQLVRRAPNPRNGSLWVAPSLFFLLATVLLSLCSLFLCMGKADRILFQNISIFLSPPTPLFQAFNLASKCNANYSVQTPIFFLAGTKQNNKESQFTAYRIIMATTANSSRKFLWCDDSSKTLTPENCNNQTYSVQNLLPNYVHLPPITADRGFSDVIFPHILFECHKQLENKGFEQ